MYSVKFPAARKFGAAAVLSAATALGACSNGINTIPEITYGHQYYEPGEAGVTTTVLSDLENVERNPADSGGPATNENVTGGNTINFESYKAYSDLALPGADRERLLKAGKQIASSIPREELTGIFGAQNGEGPVHFLTGGGFGAERTTALAISFNLQGCIYTENLRKRADKFAGLVDTAVNGVGKPLRGGAGPEPEQQAGTGSINPDARPSEEAAVGILLHPGDATPRLASKTGDGYGLSHVGKSIFARKEENFSLPFVTYKRTRYSVDVAKLHFGQVAEGKRGGTDFTPLAEIKVGAYCSNYRVPVAGRN